LIVGLPGRSNALAIAERLGLPERIVARARGLVTSEDLRADDLLDAIHQKRKEIENTQSGLRKAFQAAEELRAELRGRLAAIEDERRQVLAEAREEAEAELEELRAEIRRLRKRLMAAGQPLDVIKQVEAEAAALEDNLPARPQPVVAPLPGEESDRSFRLGDLVWVSTLGTEGQIMELSGDEAEVMVGRLRLRARLDDLAPRSKGESKREKKSGRKAAPAPSQSAAPARPPSPGLELDLRGQTVEDALPSMEDYLDAAYMAGLPYVRII